MVNDLGRGVIVATVVLVASLIVSLMLPDMPATFDRFYSIGTVVLAAAGLVGPLWN